MEIYKCRFVIILNSMLDYAPVTNCNTLNVLIAMKLKQQLTCCCFPPPEIGMASSRIGV